METPKEKVIDLLSKINNQEITPKIWDNASKGAKEDLKRKVYIIIDEVIQNLERLCTSPLGTYSNPKISYWQEVKTELNKL